MNTIFNIIDSILSIFRGIPRPVWMLTMVSFINRVGAMVICFLTIYLTEKLGFNIQNAGYIMSCYGIGAIVGAYLGGQFTDKIGYQSVQVISLILSGVLLFVLMFQRDFYSLCVTLFLLNVFAEAFRPANSVAIKVNSTDENRTRSFSLMRLGVNFAIAVALSLGGLLITIGWEYIFWIDALTCFAAAIFIYYFIPNTSRPKANLDTISTIENVEKGASQSPYRDRKFLFFIFLTFLAAMIFMQIVWTLPPYFKQVYKWDEMKIGFVNAINGLVVMFVEMPLIFFLQGKKSQKWFIRLGLFFYAISYIALVLPVNYALFASVFYMVMISFGEIFVMPFSTTYVTQVAPAATQGKYLALYTMAYSVSNVVAPLFGTQIIAHWGFDVLWIIVALLSVFTMIGFYFLEKKID